MLLEAPVLHDSDSPPFLANRMKQKTPALRLQKHKKLSQTTGISPGVTTAFAPFQITTLFIHLFNYSPFLLNCQEIRA